MDNSLKNDTILTKVYCRGAFSLATLHPQNYTKKMNKILTILALSIGFQSLQAQTIAPNDSVSIGAGYANMVFYNLATGAKTEVSNTDWHLALSIKPSPIPPSGNPQDGAAIRFNEQLGMTVFVAPQGDAATFSTIDTTGWSAAARLHDSDSKMIEGALNSNRNLSNPFDFGWGIYNQTSHNVVGDSVFIISLPGGVVKKFIVEGLIKDTAYSLKYSNLDNSDLQQIEIRKSLYINKNFVYLNLLDNTIHDKEPLNSDWDLQFLKYTGLNIQGLPAYPVTGVWTNKGATVAEATGMDLQSTDYSGQTFSTEMNTIGWDWKTFAGSGFVMTDSLIYFVKTQQAKYFKLVFTGFGGSGNGMFRFYKQDLGATGLDEVKNLEWSLFPNPVGNQLFIRNDEKMDDVKIFDLMGKVVLEKNLYGQTEAQVSMADFANGIYLVSVSGAGVTATKRLLVSH